MRLSKMIVLGAGLAALSLASDALGTASSAGSFEIGGVSMVAGGVPSFPVVAGDEIHSIGSPVVVRFQDGSRVTLSEQSRVKISNGERGIAVNLVSGNARFSLTANSSIQVFGAGSRTSGRTGSLSTITPRGQPPPGTESGAQPATRRVGITTITN